MATTKKRPTVGEQLRAEADTAKRKAAATRAAGDGEAGALWATAAEEYEAAAKHLARYQDLERQVADAKLDYSGARRRGDRARAYADQCDDRRSVPPRSGGGGRGGDGLVGPTVRSMTGAPITVRVVRPGEHYGLERKLINATDEGLIEFYDARNKRGPQNLYYDDEGQFISRYNVSTLREDRRRLEATGLDLHSGESDWQLGVMALRQVFAWLTTAALGRGGKGRRRRAPTAARPRGLDLAAAVRKLTRR